MSFRNSFLQAISRARSDGQITVLQAARLRVAALRPRKMEQIEAYVRLEADGRGVSLPLSSDGVGVNWEGIIAFLQALIPIIAQLIDLFSDD